MGAFVVKSVHDFLFVRTSENFTSDNILKSDHMWTVKRR